MDNHLIGSNDTNILPVESLLLCHQNHINPTTFLDIKRILKTPVMGFKKGQMKNIEN